MPLKLLVPLDGSVFGNAAMEVAGRLAAQAHAELNLLHVVPPAHSTEQQSSAFEPRGSGMPGDFHPPQVREVETVTQAAERQENEARDYLAGVAQRVPNTPIAFSVRCGADPAEEIVRGAQVYGADLIIMATHGQTGLRHLLLGSVAESVLRRSTIPVVLVCASPSL
jgi:nucleotide-binding universal stress UspA family protein